MNADDRGPAAEAKPPFAPGAPGAPVRREGLIPPSGSVPQRTAFRPVTGTHPTSPGTASSPAAPPAARPSGYEPPSTTPNAPSAPGAPQFAPRAPMPEQARPASAPARPSAPTPTFGPTGAGSATTTTAGSATTTTASGSSATGTATRSVGDSLGLGRLKEVAASKLKMQDPEPTLPGAPRKVRVLLSRIDPWSALKIGFLLSIAIGIMTMVASYILWHTLNAMGTWSTINEWVAKLFTQGQEVNILQFFDFGKDMSAMLLVSVVNVVLISGLFVIVAFIYNMIARVVGGVYITLTDD